MEPREPDEDESIGAIVHGIASAVTETSRAFADAAETFAREAAGALERMAERLEASLRRAQEAARAAEAALAEARQLRDDARAEAEQLRSELRDEIANLKAGAPATRFPERPEPGAATAAVEQGDAVATTPAGAQAGDAEPAQDEAPARLDAKELLDRLETDYEMLARLVQGLAGRLAAASHPIERDEPSMARVEAMDRAPTPEFETVLPSVSDEELPETIDVLLVQPHAPALESPPSPVSEAPSPQPWAAAQAAAPAWAWDAPPAFATEAVDTTRTEVTGSTSPPAQQSAFPSAPRDSSQESEAPPATEDPAADEDARAGRGTLEGQVVLKVSPVPDFDRLLALDGALGRLPFVAGVVLVDYAREEVTFRLEVASSAAAEDIRSSLTQALGLEYEVAFATPEEVRLRVRQTQ